MADTTDSNSVAERREGSNPSPRTCVCGCPPEDYMHDGWHRIYEWNMGVFSDAKKEKERRFDATIQERQALQQKVDARRMRMVRFNESRNP